MGGITVKEKSFKFDLKALSEKGEFEGYAATFQNVDKVGDLIRPGAFKRTLDHWAESGRPIPVLWQHRPSEPIGVTLEAREDENGLYVRGRLLLDVTRAKEAYTLLKEKVLGGFSIGYDIVKDSWDRGVHILEELRLFEYSLVTFPANPEAVPTGVKGISPKDVEKGLAPVDASWVKPSLGDFTSKAWDELTDDEKKKIAGHYAWSPKAVPARFSDLKLPHHRPSDGKVVWRGVRSAMAALLGARGGVDIPEADRRKVYDHLARHYRAFEKEPPEFKSFTEWELREQFPEEMDPFAELKGILNELKQALPREGDPAEGHSPLDGPGLKGGDLAALIREIKEAANLGGY